MEPDDLGFRPPPAPDDRLWRHPSEVAGVGAASGAVGAVLDPFTRAGATRNVSGVPALAVAGLSALVASLLTLGLVALTGGIGDRVVRVVERTADPTAAIGSATVTRPDVVAIAEALRPAITQIYVDGMAGQGSGSGVLFRDDGHVLTNSHVVAGADKITVVLSDGRELTAKLIGADAETDIAVVKISGGPFPTALLGTAAELRVGQPAIAIGSPLGLRGGPSVTTGVVSALGRRIDAPNRSTPLLDMIQTDAPIAPGSSGGALVDGRGAVIGITTAIAVSDVGAEGLGFATPIDVARAVANDLIASGKVTRVWIGIEGLDLAAADAKHLGITGGALVKKVVDDSPGARAGLEPDDVIVGFDKRQIESMSELVVRLRTFHPGDRIHLEVLRDGTRRTMTIELSERPNGL